MKKIKYILILFSFVILSGCSKSDLELNVDSNGTVNLIHTIMVDNSEFDTVNQLLDITSEKTVYKGYTIERVSDKNRTGYKMYKTLGKINKISKNDNDEVELTKYATTLFDDSKMFTYKNGIFFDSYTASFTVDLTDIDGAIQYLPLLHGVSYNYTPRTNVVRLNSTGTDIARYTKNVENIFSLDSQISVGKNNATRKENGKYIWDIKFGEVNKIEFTINKANTGIILLLIVIIVIIGLVYYFIRFRNKLLKAYDSVSYKDSLALENKVLKYAEMRDIKTRANRKINDEMLNDKENINQVIMGDNSSLGPYTNQKTLEELSSDITNHSGKHISSYTEKDPDFKMSEVQIKEEFEKLKSEGLVEEKDRKSKFINKDK